MKRISALRKCTVIGLCLLLASFFVTIGCNNEFKPFKDQVCSKDDSGKTAQVKVTILRSAQNAVQALINGEPVFEFKIDPDKSPLSQKEFWIKAALNQAVKMGLDAVAPGARKALKALKTCKSCMLTEQGCKPTFSWIAFFTKTIPGLIKDFTPWPIGTALDLVVELKKKCRGCTDTCQAVGQAIDKNPVTKERIRIVRDIKTCDIDPEDSVQDDYNYALAENIPVRLTILNNNAVLVLAGDATGDGYVNGDDLRAVVTGAVACPNAVTLTPGVIDANQYAFAVRTGEIRPCTLEDAQKLTDSWNTWLESLAVAWAATSSPSPIASPSLATSITTPISRSTTAPSSTYSATTSTSRLGNVKELSGSY
jgi:hypothetical protein